MSNLAAVQQAPTLASFSPEQRDLIKRTVAPDATNDELAMFLHVAAKSGLDPLQRQIWFVKRSGRVTIQAGIDGLQARAAREPDYMGMTYGVVCEKDEFQFDATTGTVKAHTYNPFGQRGKTLGAWCIVQRKGLLPFSAMARFEEFVQSQSPLWRDKPAVMIEKVARSTALRRAYPEQFGGLYEPAEMGDKAHAEPAEPEVVLPKKNHKAVSAALSDVTPEVVAQAQAVEAQKPPPVEVEETLAKKLWARAKTKWGSHAMTHFREAVRTAGIPDSTPSDSWTLDQVEAVELALFPPKAEDTTAPGDLADVPF